MRTCSACGQLKPIERFSIDPKGIDGSAQTCKDCRKVWELKKNMNPKTRERLERLEIISKQGSKETVRIEHKEMVRHGVNYTGVITYKSII